MIKSKELKNKKKLLKEKNTDGLRVSNPKTPKLYMLPKIHQKDSPVDHH